MIRQKSSKKCTAVGKRRVDLFKLEQAVKRQLGINQRLSSICRAQGLLIEDLEQRVRDLEQGAQPEMVEPRGWLTRLVAKLN